MARWSRLAPPVRRRFVEGRYEGLGRLRTKAEGILCKTAETFRNHTRSAKLSPPMVKAILSALSSTG